MDTAVAFVETYLRVNGYFTVTEFPVLESCHYGVKTLTDLDILAVRFPFAGRLLPGQRQDQGLVFTPDPALGGVIGETDMIIGEVKEGRAHLNDAMREPAVLQAVLSRFGCCNHEHVPHVVEALLRKGKALTYSGHQVRIVVFAGSPDLDTGHGFQTISLAHVTGYLQDYLRQYWGFIKQAQFKDPVFSSLVMLEKTNSMSGGGEGNMR